MYSQMDRINSRQRLQCAGNHIAMAGLVVALEAEQCNCPFQFDAEILEQRLLAVKMLLEISEESPIIVIVPQAVANLLRGPQCALMAITDADALQPKA